MGRIYLNGKQFGRIFLNEIEYTDGKKPIEVVDTQVVGIHEGRVVLTDGTVTADTNYYYTDYFDCPQDGVLFDVYETNSDAGFAWYDSNGTYVNYWVANTRFRWVDMSSYYQSGYKCRFTFKKANPSFLIDYAANIIYSTFNADSLGGTSNFDPTLTYEDPLGAISSDTTYTNIEPPISYFYIEKGELKKALAFYVQGSSGYEGLSLPLANFGLRPGQNYKVSFEFDANGCSLSGSYPWGIKYSSTRVPASGSAGSSTFNLTPDVNFSTSTGKQNVEMTFTASNDNFLLVLISRIAASNNLWMYLRNFEIKEVN